MDKARPAPAKRPRLNDREAMDPVSPEREWWEVMDAFSSPTPKLEGKEEADTEDEQSERSWYRQAGVYAMAEEVPGDPAEETEEEEKDEEDEAEEEEEEASIFVSFCPFLDKSCALAWTTCT